MAKIISVRAREVLDSRGVPTIEGILTAEGGIEVRAQASSGESIGKNEGAELRDRDENRYQGMGVIKAVSYINDAIGKKLVGADVSNHIDIDYWLLKADGTKDRSHLGVNTIMTVSQLLLKAAAAAEELPLYRFVNKQCNKYVEKPIVIERLPSPIFNIINGGKHGSTNLEFQEFHIIPSTSAKFSDALEMGSGIYATLKQVLEYRNAATAVSEEGGFSPNLLTNIDALEVIKEAISQKRLRLGVDVFMGLDCASSHYFRGGKYTIKDKPQSLSPDDYMTFMIGLTTDYKILILEDALSEEDEESWIKLTESLGGTVYIASDDFTAGNRDRVANIISKKACNAVLLKFNQVATIAELFELSALLKKNGIKIVFSQRLGETTDSILADLAVGVGADFVKFGSPVRGERVVKYNRLLEIETEIAQKTLVKDHIQDVKTK